MNRRPRNPTPGERALWEAHARRYRPLATTPRPALPEPKPAPTPPPQAPEAPAPPIEPFRVGERARAMGSVASAAPPAPTLAPPTDRRARRALARGRVNPEARMDLHGMTLDHAHSSLQRFVSRAWEEDRRLVLVITGKGRAAEAASLFERPRGVLRRQVPLWLSQPPLASMVTGVSEAHRRHGGEGALYVHLRRRPG